MSEREKYRLDDVASIIALGGSVPATDILRAHVNSNNGEHRPQQLQMCDAVADAFATRQHVVVQAGTGTGKSFAYLFPIVMRGGRAVIATATNQLSEQLAGNDLPAVEKSMRAVGKSFTYTILKGRSNYACLNKLDELERLDAIAPGNNNTGDEGSPVLFGLDESAPTTSRPAKTNPLVRAEVQDIRNLTVWAKKTRSGDRSEAPPVSEDAWRQVSSTSAECPGATKCSFGEQCFTEKARLRAKVVDVVVTNHALLATSTAVSVNETDDDSDGLRVMFGAVDALVIDEAHDYPETLTSALSSQFAVHTVRKSVGAAAAFLPLTPVMTTALTARETFVDPLENSLTELETALKSEPEGAITTFHPDTFAIALTTVQHLRTLVKAVQKEILTMEDGSSRMLRAGMVYEDLLTAWATLNKVLDPPNLTVRWVSHRSTDSGEKRTSLNVAPIDVGSVVRQTVKECTLVATSATLTLDHDFAPTLNAFGLPTSTRTVDVGSPFNYPRQGMLYVPSPPFPEPVGKDRFEHKAAVFDEITALVTAAGGRTLALFTTRQSALDAANHLRQVLPPHIEVYAHGDAPAARLVSDFIADETSVLCATMGLWQGVSADGPTCSLVIIDKLAFTPPSDVLTAARQQFAVEQGRDGFREIVLAQAATRVAQGAGRLIRTSSDKGVVAILDPRLRSKRYGQTILQSLPPFRLYTDRTVVTDALQRLTGGIAPQPHGIPVVRRTKLSAKPKPAKKTSTKTSARRKSAKPTVTGKRIPKRS